eukprot:scaffold12000_cov14-Prasinocladus_malaysianus.AAC.1
MTTRCWPLSPPICSPKTRANVQPRICPRSTLRNILSNVKCNTTVQLRQTQITSLERASQSPDSNQIVCPFMSPDRCWRTSYGVCDGGEIFCLSRIYEEDKKKASWHTGLACL